MSLRPSSLVVAALVGSACSAPSVLPSAFEAASFALAPSDALASSRAGDRFLGGSPPTAFEPTAGVLDDDVAEALPLEWSLLASGAPVAEHFLCGAETYGADTALIPVHEGAFDFFVRDIDVEGGAPLSCRLGSLGAVPGAPEQRQPYYFAIELQPASRVSPPQVAWGSVSFPLARPADGRDERTQIAATAQSFALAPGRYRVLVNWDLRYFGVFDVAESFEPSPEPPSLAANEANPEAFNGAPPELSDPGCRSITRWASGDAGFVTSTTAGPVPAPNAVTATREHVLLTSELEGGVHVFTREGELLQRVPLPGAQVAALTSVELPSGAVDVFALTREGTGAQVHRLTLEGGAFVDDGRPTRVEGAPAGAWAAAGIARDHQGRFAVGFATPVRDDIREVTVLFLREDRSVESLSRQLIEQPRESKVLPIGALDDGRAVIADGDALTFHHRDGLAPTEPVSIEPPPGNVVGPKLLGGLAILEGDVMILNDDRNGRLRRVELTGALVPNDVDPLTTVFDANIEAVPFPDPPAGRTTTRALTVAPDGLVVFTDNADRVMLIGQSCE